MRRALIHLITTLTMIIPALALSADHVQARQDGGAYESPELGVTFNLPAGWQVTTEANNLVAASPEDLAAVQSGQPPAGLVLRVVTGSFSELGLADAAALPELLGQLAPSGAGAPAPTPVTCGNCEGFQIITAIPDAGLTTAIALLAVVGGRVAIVRGLAPSGVWDASGQAQFQGLLSTMMFSLPERNNNPLAAITANDGGVMWHYREPQPGDRTVRAGGITYDTFGIMYMAAGPAGILTLDMSNGAPISFMGPWGGGDYADLAIGPDTRLYLANVSDQPGEAVTVVDRAGNYYRGWGVRGNADGQFAPGMPRTIAVTAGGDVWTVSEGHSEGITNRLYKFDTYGNLLLTVDLGTVNPQLAQVRIDNNVATGALYVTGATGSLNIVDPNGQTLVRNLAQDLLQGVTPLDIAVAPDDNLLLALAAPGFEGFGYLEISTGGSLLDAFGVPYDAERGGPFLPGEYQSPAGLVAATNDMVYATETHPETGITQVQAFSFRGDGRLTLANQSGDDGAGAPMTVIPEEGGGTIAYGMTVRGALNNRYPVHEWRFEGQAGDRVMITMTDASGQGALDPELVLVSAAGVELGRNDDAGDGAPEGVGPRDALITFDLPTAGEFVINATRFGGRGEYLLSLQKLE